MDEKKTPREWARELGLIEVRRPVGGQSILGEELIEVSASAYAAAAALHLWAHDEYHATEAERLRISRAVFESALAAGTQLLLTEAGFAHVPAPEALGKHTPKELVERAVKLRASSPKEPE